MIRIDWNDRCLEGDVGNSREQSVRDRKGSQTKLEGQGRTRGFDTESEGSERKSK
jgi:hypothetical protein